MLISYLLSECSLTQKKKKKEEADLFYVGSLSIYQAQKKGEGRKTRKTLVVKTQGGGIQKKESIKSASAASCVSFLPTSLRNEKHVTSPPATFCMGYNSEL